MKTINGIVVKDTKNKSMATVIIANSNGKTLLQKGDKFYIIPATGHYVGENVMIDPEKTLMVPTLLAAMNIFISNKNMDETKEFVKKLFNLTEKK